MNKFFNLLYVLFFGVIINLALVISLNAEDGQLVEAYPPNVKAENFKLSDLTGDMHELSDFRGKYVLVNFWAMSCTVCKSEMTTLQSAQELIDRDNLAVISIHAGDSSDEVEAVLKLNGITYPVLFDVDLQLGSWGVPILPTTFLVTPEGDVRFRAAGTRIWNAPFMIDFMQGILDSNETQLTTSKPL